MKRNPILDWGVVLYILINLTACATINPNADPVETEELILSEEDKVSPETVDMEIIFDENRGLPVLRENALTFHDYYRGAVQRKEEAEALLKEGKWSEAETLLLESNKWLKIVHKIKMDDELNFPVYQHAAIRYLPNYLLGDNYYKLAIIFQKQGKLYEGIDSSQSSLMFLEKSLAPKPFPLARNTFKEVEKLLNRLLNAFMEINPI